MGLSRTPRASARARYVFAILLTGAVTVPALAAYEAPNPAYNPPANYYNNATGTGNTLRLNLHAIVSTGFSQKSYDTAREALGDTDKDPNNPANLLTIYDRISVSSVWDSGVTWNREHMWPASRINGSTSGPTADLFELRPANSKTNGGRGNLPYGGGAGASGGPFVASNYFFPGDADKGDCARAMFYMATMYYTGSTTLSSTNLQLINGYAIGSLPDYKMGDLASMLAWNYQDGVDNFERRRNQMIYANTIHPSDSQNNRNPYVDHPEYVWAVFGTGANTSQISVGTPDASGASSVTVNLGRIFVGGTLGTGNVTFTKTGTTPTTFDITTSGNATMGAAIANSTLGAGTGQGIDYNNQTRTIVAGLNASTATAGVKSGTITIHNTDLTSAGAGQGSADGNDTINVTAQVLNHAAPSFDVATKTTTLTIDFGVIPLGGAAATRGFSVANVQSSALTAGLDLNSVSINGSAALSMDVAAFQNLGAGMSQGFTAILSAAGAGVFSATDVVHVSDDHTIAGALSSDLTLNLTGAVALLGDANVDGSVDLSDLAIVLNNFGQATSSWRAGNFDGGATVGSSDLNVVMSNFGQTVAMGAGTNAATTTLLAAPEPGALVLMIAGMGAAISWRGRGLRRRSGGG